VPADPGCPACRDRRGRIVMVEYQRQREGLVTALEPLPAPCSACGRVAEFVVQVIHPHAEDWTAEGSHVAG